MAETASNTNGINSYITPNIIKCLGTDEHRRVVNYYIQSTDRVYLTKDQLKLLQDVLIIIGVPPSVVCDIYKRTYTSANVRQIIDYFKS